MHSRSETDVSPAIKRPLNHVGINTFYVEILSKVMMDRGLECWGTLMGNAVNAGFTEIFYRLDVHVFLSRGGGSGDIWSAGEIPPHLIDKRLSPDPSLDRKCLNHHNSLLLERSSVRINTCEACI